MKTLKNITLEISLKPFYEGNDESVRTKFAEIFKHWYPILKHADMVSVMYWVGDGTEIFEFNNDLGATFEWGKWLGFVHDRYEVSEDRDPHHECLIAYAREYRDNPPEFTYNDLKKNIAIMKETGTEILGKPIRAGATMDPGPEFVHSEFKFEKHPEILWGGQGGCGNNIDCTAKFNADDQAYAGFPNGIPEGTSFGTFFGRQAELFMNAVGFDYIWYSNSFGFGRCPYGFGAFGEFFDGKDYLPEGNQECRDEVLKFWQDFRNECPEKAIETRGTDFPVGLDWVNHATPFKELYEGDLNLVPPPNTPWPALTKNYGIALAGYMSRIAAFPGDYPYRFYASDPWWCNSACRDMFEGSPHDIYMSLAIAKIDGDGSIHTPNRLSVLSIDTSWGEIPEEFPDELVPHLKKGFDHAADQASPFIWIYPFEEYNRMTFENTNRMNEVFAGDLIIQEAVNCGLPLNTVVTTDNYLKTCEEGKLYGNRVLLTPVPDGGSELEKSLLVHIDAGGKLLLYGPAENAGDALLSRLGISLEKPLAGEFGISLSHEIDSFAAGANSAKMLHNANFGAGGIRETQTGNVADSLFCAEATQGGEKRLVAIVKSSGSGTLGWIRGSSSFNIDLEKRAEAGRILPTWNPKDCFKCENLYRYASSAMGYHVAFHRDEPNRTSAHLMTVRNRNAFYFSAFSNDDSVSAELRFPWGAPLFTGLNNQLKDGKTILPFWHFQHRECRLFIDGQEAGTLGVHRVSPKHFRYRNRLVLDGLKNANLRYYPVKADEHETHVLLNPDRNTWTASEPMDMEVKEDASGVFCEIRNVSGTMSFAWW